MSNSYDLRDRWGRRFNLPVWGSSNGNQIFTNLTVTGTLSVAGATTLSSTLAVTGASTLTGAVTMASTLAVTGATTITGDLAVNGGDLTSTATTFNLLNATVTTLNIGGAANTINIGAQAAYFTNAGWNTGVLTNMLGIVGSVNPGLLVDASSGSSTAAKVIVNCAADTSYGKFQFRVANTKYFEWAMQGNALTSMKLFYSDSDTLCATFTSAGALTMVDAVAATGYTATATGFTSQFLSRRSDNTAGARCAPYLMQGVNASSSYVTYAGIYGRSDTLTAGAEDGSLLAYTMRAGTLTLAATIDKNANTTLNGDLTLVGGDIIASTATTWNVLNTVATTINFAGAASTALNIGNATGPITFAGRIVTTLSSTTRAYFNLPHGAAPSAPVDGDVWTTSSGIYVRINGATVGPLS